MVQATSKVRREAPANKDIVEELLADWKLERPDLDARPMSVVGRLLQLGKLLEARASAVLKPFGLQYTELDVLATLRRTGDPYRLGPTELKDSVLISSGAMTVCLDRLEARGLIRRQPHEADRRRILVSLTAKGKSVVDRAIAARFDEAERALEPLNAAERKRLADLLKVLLDGVREGS